MSLVELSSKQHLIDTVSILQREQKHKMVVLYFYKESEPICQLIGQKFKEANANYNNNNMMFLFINVEDSNNINIVSMFHIKMVPYCIIMRDGFILQKLYDSSLRDFLFTLDECAPIIYNIHETNNNIKKHINNNPGFESEHFICDEMDTETLDNEMDTKIDRLVNVAPVMIFIKGTPTRPKCRYSRQLIELLRNNKVRFGFFDVLRDSVIKDELKRYSDWPTFPQLYINGEFQGGLDIIKDNIREEPNFFQSRI